MSECTTGASLVIFVEYICVCMYVCMCMYVCIYVCIFPVFRRNSSQYIFSLRRRFFSLHILPSVSLRWLGARVARNSIEVSNKVCPGGVKGGALHDRLEDHPNPHHCHSQFNHHQQFFRHNIPNPTSPSITAPNMREALSDSPLGKVYLQHC